MFTAFSTALSGLTANATAINVIGNDLANLNTTGYKASEISFRDLIGQSLGTGANSGQVGLGVGSVNAARNYTQGSIQTTGGAMDQAIEGSGFFVVKDQNNQTLYTRDGSFHVDSSGNVITGTGAKVQGWTATAGAVNATGAVGNLTVPLGASLAATPTTTMSVALNLDSRVDTAAAAATFSSPIQAVDSLGASHTLTVTFTKTAANSWNYAVTIPNADLQAGGAGPLASGAITFDPNGQILTPAVAAGTVAVKAAGLADGAADLNISWNLYSPSGQSAITQFAEASATAAATQNGYSAGQLSKLSLEDNGALVANYSNGQQMTVGQIALASIGNPDTMTAVGNNNFAVSAATAQPAIGAANTGSRGQIIGGALESSTVDISQEFTQLLTVQRSYQANSRVITASDQLLQDAINMIHP